MLPRFLLVLCLSLSSTVLAMSPPPRAVLVPVLDDRPRNVAHDNESLRASVAAYLNKDSEPDAYAAVRSSYGDISSWDTSSVGDFSSLFRDAPTFTADLSRWDTSSVTNMGAMFWGAAAFNSDLSKWDTGKVTNMGGTFIHAAAFNSDLSKWDTSKVTNLSSMFRDATSFDANLSKWDTSSANNLHGVFFNAKAFKGDLKGWDTSGISEEERAQWEEENRERVERFAEEL